MSKNKQQQIDNLKAANGRLIADNQSLAEKLELMQETIESQVSQIAMLSDQNTEYVTRIHSLGTSLAVSKVMDSEQAKSSTSENDLSERVLELEELLRKSQEEIQYLRLTEVAATSEDRSTINSGSDAPQADISRLEAENQALRKQIDDLMTASSQILSTDNAKDSVVEDPTEVLNARIAQLEDIVQRRDAEITKIRGELGLATTSASDAAEASKKQQLTIQKQIEANDQLKATVKKLEVELNNMKLAALEESHTPHRLEEKDIQIANLQQELADLKASSMKAAILAEAKNRQQRAEEAIDRLKMAISASNTPTSADKALQGIINCLNAGLVSTDPQLHFTNEKETLKKHVSTLQYHWKSIVNTVVNAILTVLAVVSVVGITALWLTGTLQSNLHNKGSSFAFTTFGSKQKAEQDIHVVKSAMGMSRGG